MRITRTHLFLLLLLIFTVSGVINIGIWQHFAPSMTSELAPALRKEIIQVHSVLIAALLGGLFARPATGLRVKIAHAIPMVMLSLLWAVYVGTAWLGYPSNIGVNGSDGLMGQFNDRATEISAIVSAVLVFICNKRSESN